MSKIRTAPTHRTAAALAWLGLLCVLCGTAGPARAGTVPEDKQVPILFKMLTYDRTLAEQSDEVIHLAILAREGRDASEAGAAAFAAALSGQKDKTVNGRAFTFTTVTYREGVDLAAVLAAEHVDVLYVTHGCRDILDEIRSAVRTLDVLTLAAGADDVRDGLSIGLDLKDDRPRIVVNLEALHDEGHDLESRALRLCEVITKP